MSHPIYQPWTKPFQSGSCMCKPSTDYVQYMKGGAKKQRRGRRQRGGNPTAVQEALRVPSTAADLAGNGYGAAALAEHLTGEGVHTAPEPMTTQFKSTNMGLNWATNGGAKAKKAKKAKRSPAKKRKSPKKSAKKVKRKMKRGKSKTRKSTKQRGGVTPFPMRYFNPDYPASSTNNSSGDASAYGTIEGHSQPNTNLAPFPNATGMQTGGHVPKHISDTHHVNSKIENTVNPQVDEMKSQNDAMNGTSGGAKKKRSTTKKAKRSPKKGKKVKRKSPAKKRSPSKKRNSPKKRSLLKRMGNSVKTAASNVKRALSPKRIVKSVKKTASKVKKALTPKRKSSRKQKGGGSDWRMVQYSRGAYNNPDMPEAQFRAFNKSNAYIPNTKLWEFATPLLNNSDSSCTGPAPVSQSGAGKKNAKHKSPKRKSPTKKRKSPKRKTSKRK